MANVKSLRSVKAVVFDLDGTLIDTAPDLVAATNHTLAKHGYNTQPFDLLKNAASHGSIALLKAALPHASDDEINSLKDSFFNNYQNINGDNSACYPGILDLLKTIKGKDLALGIVTNKPARFVYPLLEKLKINSFFDVIICGDSTKYSKPHVAPMLLASQRINISCENIAYLGDAQRDMDAANDVKMLSVLALWGYIDALDKIELWQADLAFETATKFKQALLAN